MHIGKKKRILSGYNEFMSVQLHHKDASHKEAFTAVALSWATAAENPKRVVVAASTAQQLDKEGDNYSTPSTPAMPS